MILFRNTDVLLRRLVSMLHNGLYEQIINKRLDIELAATDKLSQTTPIDSAEASKVLAKYVAAKLMASAMTSALNVVSVVSMG